MPNVLKGLVSADWHLDGLAKHFENHIERQFYELDKIYKYAIENGINHVFVPGDVSDTPNMPEDVYVALILFLKKYDGLVNTHYIAGNHDFANINKTSMDLLDVICREGFFNTFNLYLNPHSTVIDGVPVNFLPYPCIEAPESDIAHLNFSHIEYNGAIGDNGRKLRTKHEFIQNPGDYNISGHIHQYQDLPTKRALYCGNPYQKNFGESLPKGWVEFKAKATEDHITLKHKFIQNKPDFKFVNVTITCPDDFAKLSTSDSIRYKLWIDPSVEVPKNLTLRHPNITGGIFDIASKKKADDSVDVQEHEIPDGARINLRSGLSRYLKDKGFTKKQAKMAHLEVKRAADILGIQLQ